MDLDDDELQATKILNGSDTREHRVYAIKFAVMQKQIKEKDKEIDLMAEHIQNGCDFDNRIKTKEEIKQYFKRKYPFVGKRGVKNGRRKSKEVYKSI